MLRPIFIMVIALTGSVMSFAQAKEMMYTDVFNGKVPVGNSFIIKLKLVHCRYCDEGTFVLHRMPMESIAGTKPTATAGEWTVLKGSAKDENATVVEIDAAKDTLYFLRLKKGDLQQLDNRLREIMPAARYVLRRQ